MTKKKLTKFWLGLEASVLCLGLTLVPSGKALTQEVGNNNKDSKVSSAAADAWGKIAEDYQDKVTKLSNKELDTAISSLESVLKIIEDPFASRCY